MATDHLVLAVVEESAPAVAERIAAGLEEIARELRLIREHLEEPQAGTPSVAASSGPWLRRLPARERRR